MALLFRGKQAGVHGDLSAGISPEIFVLDDYARYGINSQVSALAYEPIQSLLAVGTNESQYGPGQVYVFGQRRVCVTFTPSRRASIKSIQFCADKLIVLDSKNGVHIYDMARKKIIASYFPPGMVSVIVTDPTLDYCLTGLQSGEIVAYDLDREMLTHFKIPNFWRERSLKTPLLPVHTLQFHPKDIGTLLIGYTEGAVIYSFKQNKPVKFFQYEVPKGAQGGDGDPTMVNRARYPRLTHALWHPTGTFIVTAYDDSSLAFWDPRDGRLLEARTIQDTAVHLPGSGYAGTSSPSMRTGIKEPYFDIAWICKEDTEDTGLLIAGGSPTSNPTSGLTYIEFGITPNYQTSSWDVLTNYFRNPHRIRVLPTPPGPRITKFLLVPRSTSFYNGSHDPMAIIITLESGEVTTITFPSGQPISPTNQLHLSLSFVHPFATKISMAAIDRTRWLGLREVRQHTPSFLLGGAEGAKPMKRFESRNIVQVAHADGTIRLWDAGNDDAIENGVVLQADLGRALGRMDDLHVAEMSMSGATAELSVGMTAGEVVIFRLNRNQFAGRPISGVIQNRGPGHLTDISQRADPGLKEGLLPLTLMNQDEGPVTALKHSDIGFVAVGFGSGAFNVIDMRGPAIIHDARIPMLTQKQRRGTIYKRQSVAVVAEFATSIEFSVMTLEGDSYSSIAMFVGTNRGKVITFKILPSQSGRYSVDVAGVEHLSDDKVIAICPIVTETGEPAVATGKAVSGLQSGIKTEGTLVVTTVSSIHVFRPPSARAASKSFDNYLCDSATMAQYENRGWALVGLFGDGCTRAFSIPALKEVGSAKIDKVLDVKRFSEAVLTPAGTIMGWTGPSELALMNVWGTKQAFSPSNDTLYDPGKIYPPRPTISSLQWISGTQYITPADMDILIGGPDRPPSKKMLAQMSAQRQQEARDAQANKYSNQPLQQSSSNQEGYWAYMQRQLAERTENLGLASDNMSKVQESSANFGDNVSKFVAKQKRAAAMGLISSKLGL